MRRTDDVGRENAQNESYRGCLLGRITMRALVEAREGDNAGAQLHLKRG